MEHEAQKANWGRRKSALMLQKAEQSVEMQFYGAPYRCRENFQQFDFSDFTFSNICIILKI
jgi:hypothetical protein